MTNARSAARFDILDLMYIRGAGTSDMAARLVAMDAALEDDEKIPPIAKEMARLQSKAGSLKAPILVRDDDDFHLECYPAALEDLEIFIRGVRRMPLGR